CPLNRLGPGTIVNVCHVLAGGTDRRGTRVVTDRVRRAGRVIDERDLSRLRVVQVYAGVVQRFPGELVGVRLALGLPGQQVIVVTGEGHGGAVLANDRLQRGTGGLVGGLALVIQAPVARGGRQTRHVVNQLHAVRIFVIKEDVDGHGG